MKTALLFLSIPILFLIISLNRVDVWMINSKTIDIHFHNTYFVIDHVTALIALVVVLGTFFFTGGVIGTKFRKRFFLIGFLIFIVVDLYLGWRINALFHS